MIKSKFGFFGFLKNTYFCHQFSCISSIINILKILNPYINHKTHETPNIKFTNCQDPLLARYSPFSSYLANKVSQKLVKVIFGLVWESCFQEVIFWGRVWIVLLKLWKGLMMARYDSFQWQGESDRQTDKPSFQRFHMHVQSLHPQGLCS